MEQLSLQVETPVDPDVRWAWSALPFRDVRACRQCGEQRMCAGRRRSSQLCLACFALASRPRKRRRGSAGTGTVPRP